MSQSPPPNNSYNQRLQGDVRKLMENLYFKKVGRNNEKLNLQVLNMISEVFDGKQQQVKQAQITHLKERLDTLCTTQQDIINSPTRGSPHLEYRMKDTTQVDNQQQIQMKLPKLFKHRDTVALINQKYSQYGTQLSSRLDQNNLKSQRSQSPQQPQISQRENILRAYCNEPINSTPKKKDFNPLTQLRQERNTSYDALNVQVTTNNTATRRKVQYQEQSNPQYYYFNNEEKLKIIPKAISSLNNTPTRKNMKLIQLNNKVKRDEQQVEKSKLQINSLNNKNNRNSSTDYEDIYNDYNKRKQNKAIVLSSQKGDAPDASDKLIKRERMNTNSLAYINEFVDVPQYTQASIKNINESPENILPMKDYKKDRMARNIKREDIQKNENTHLKKLETDFYKEQSSPNTYFYGQNYSNANVVKQKKIMSGQERSSSQNSYLKENQLSVNNNVKTDNRQNKQKNYLNNSMIVIQDDSPQRDNLKSSLQIIPTNNSFLKEVKSTQEYLQEHNNDIWTLIAKFNIQKDQDIKKRAIQSHQDQQNNFKTGLDNQIIQKMEHAKNTFQNEQDYLKIAQKELKNEQYMQKNERFESFKKKRQQNMFLESQIIEKHEHQQKQNKQIEQEHLNFIKSLKQQQQDEDQQKITQQKKQKQMYEGIKQDYFERFKRVSPNEINEDSKFLYEKKRIASYMRELDHQRQSSSQSTYINEPIEKLVQREKLKPVDNEILKDWADQINEKQKHIIESKDQEKKLVEQYMQQCEKEEESEVRKNLEYKVKVALNQQQIKDQAQHKKSNKTQAATEFEIQNNQAILKEIDDYIRNSQLIQE